MNLLLDLLDPINCPAIQSATLLTLVTALLDQPANTRTFEELDGLLTVTSLFKQRATSREVKLKLVEFLYFYLMPETPTYPIGASAPNTAVCGGARAWRKGPWGYAHDRGEAGSVRAISQQCGGPSGGSEGDGSLWNDGLLACGHDVLD
jgi:hypothetical protein